MNELRISTSIIKKALEKELQYTPSSALEFDTVAKCYLYLGDKENSIKYFLEAIKDVERLVEVFSNDEGKVFQYLKRTLNRANYLRILGRSTEATIILEELAPLYNSLYTGKIKENPELFRGFYYEWSTVLFHLKKYKEAYDIGTLIRHGTVSPRGYSKGLISDDQSIIKKSLEEIVKDIKEARIQPFHNPLNIQDPWEWYEIGKQLLGLPSVLNMFKEDFE